MRSQIRPPEERQPGGRKRWQLGLQSRQGRVEECRQAPFFLTQGANCPCYTSDGKFTLSYIPLLQISASFFHLSLGVSYFPITYNAPASPYFSSWALFAFNVLALSLPSWLAWSGLCSSTDPSVLCVAFSPHRGTGMVCQDSVFDSFDCS